MSIIQTLRGKGSTVVTVLLIIALVAFLLMDSVSSKISTMFNDDPTLTGEVNGQRIESQEYQQRLQDLEEYTKNSSGKTSLTDQEREGLQSQVWNQLVNEQLLKEEMDALGIEVGDKEFQDLMTSPIFAAQEIRQNFTDPATGLFNPQRVIETETSMAQSKDLKQKEQWRKFKDGLAKNRQVSKYSAMIRNGIYTPTFILDDLAAQKNKMSNISYVMVPYSSADGTLKVTDEEIKSFMSKRAEVYTNENDALSFEYISVPIIPSPADSAESLGFLNTVQEGFAAAENPIEYARDNSEELVDEDYYNISTLKNANAAALVAAPVGTIVGPYYDNQAYKLSKIVAKKQMPDSARISRIFVGISDQRNETQAEALIDSIRQQLSAGVSFAQLAATRSDDQNTAQKGGDLGYIVPGMIEKEANEVVFGGKTGDIKKVKTRAGFQLIKITDQKNYQANVKLATIAKSMTASEKTTQLAIQKAQKFKDAAKDEASFKDQAKKMGMDKRIAQKITKSQMNIQGLGSVKELVRWAYSAEVGDISNALTFEDKCIVARVTSKLKKGEMGDINVFRTEIESQILKKKKAEQIAAKGKGKNNLAAIAQLFGTEVKTADSVSMSMLAPGVMGYEPKVAAAASNKNLVNKVSPGIAGEQGVYFINVKNIIDNTKTAQRVPQIERMQAQMQYMNGIDQLIPVVLRKRADITDNRR